MHEAGMTEEMLKVVLEKASEAGISKITRIDLVIGEMSHVTPESVNLYFDVLSKDTAAEGAVLSFRTGEGYHDFYVERIEGE